MANRRYNTQTRKMFSEGTKQIDKTPGKNMSARDKANLEKRMERRKQFNKKRKTLNKTTKDKVKQPIGKPPLKKEPLRKPSDKQQREMRRVKELERRQFGKTSEDKKPRINKLKDKINKVGNMKVKDAAKAVGKGILAGTPIGSAKNIADAVNKNFKFQSPIVRKNRKFGGR